MHQIGTGTNLVIRSDRNILIQRLKPFIFSTILTRRWLNNNNQSRKCGRFKTFWFESGSATKRIRILRLDPDPPKWIQEMIIPEYLVSSSSSDWYSPSPSTKIFPEYSAGKNYRTVQCCGSGSALDQDSKYGSGSRKEMVAKDVRFKI